MAALAAAETYFYRPADGHGLDRDPLKAIIAPRPIGWISTRSPTGVANLAPYSFFAMLCDQPPILGFSSMGRKDTLANIEATGEFVYNLATRPLADAVNISSATWAAATDEFEEAGVTALTGRVVDCPLVKESPVSLECRLVEIIQLTTADKIAVQTWLVLGEIVGVHIDYACLVDGRFDTGAARVIQRAGYGADYFEVLPQGWFSMRRPGSR